MADEGGMGVGTVVSVLLILIGLVAIAGAVLYGAFPGVNNAVKGLLGEKGEVGKIFDEVFNEENLVKAKDKKNAGLILNEFRKILSIQKEECIQEISFENIENKDLVVEVENKLVKVIKGNSLRVDVLQSNKNIFFMQRKIIEAEPQDIIDIEEGREGFSITDGLTKINNGERMGNFAYKKGDILYILDQYVANEFEKGSFFTEQKEKCTV